MLVSLLDWVMSGDFLIFAIKMEAVRKIKFNNNEIIQLFLFVFLCIVVRKSMYVHSIRVCDVIHNIYSRY